MAQEKFYHAVGILAGNRSKTVKNKTKDQILAQCVLPFIANRTMNTTWGSKANAVQALELRVFTSSSAWDSRVDGKFEEWIKKLGIKNRYNQLRKEAEATYGSKRHRVFVVMPIQGEKYGTQNDQRIYKEFDDRFKKIEKLLKRYDCLTIRIDKEHPIDEMVKTIKEEIKISRFIVADLTEERPSCYFEAGYADALGKKVIYIASKDSIITTTQKTRIHFDVHMNVNLFTNHEEMIEKLDSAIKKNKDKLFPAPEQES